ncbi:MAG: dTDP-glucose 4,6-dehydratase [Candidatus Omnitrophica bacterium]|nr:dTDP-glucose 4,6-dehydratase [Candidatus Omnitrophota bacterium]
MKKVLITGGCGFIGSNFIKGFIQSHPEWKIINFDKLTYCGNRAYTKELEGNQRYEFVHGDICDGGVVNMVVEDVEAIIHFAAETHVDRSIDSADDFLHTNIFGTRTLLESAKRFDIKRFIHISSDEVYGSIEKGFVSEDSPLQPNNPYSASKAASDLLVRAYWRTYQMPLVIVRSSNNYGPNQFPEKVIPLFITNLLEGKKVPLYAKGENRRDWIFVQDNCRAIEMVFDKGEPGGVYNIPGGQETSNVDLTKRILKLLGKSEDMIQEVNDRPGHDFRYAMEGKKIQNLGFRPQYDLNQGLELTVQWYRENIQWWQPLKRDKFTVK